MPYDLESVDLPRLRGRALLLFARALESAPTRGILIRQLLQKSGLGRIRTLRLDEPPTMYPIWPRPDRDLPPPSPSDLAALALPTSGEEAGRPATIGDYAGAYRRKETTPDEVARRFLAALAESEALDPPLRAFIACDDDDLMRQARDSTRRHQEGAPLGPLDGVPIAIKDEVDQVPYPTTAGTSFLGAEPAAADSTVVARLRAAGALLVGKTHMHEIGINPNGLNVHHGVARNPYDLSRDTGGSSSGSAAVVAAGLCPGAIGADGGGSIRIPAALCGVVGLKATLARISEVGAVPLCWSVAHLGPIAATVADAALLYAVIAGPDPGDPHTAQAPPVSLAGIDSTDLSELRLGVYRPWFEHADSEVVASCRAALEELTRRGARVTDIEIEELEEMRAAHAVTILSEMAASMANYPEHARDFGAGVRVNLAAGGAFTSRDYVRAQRMRTRAMAIFDRVFDEVDVLITPATAMTAPPIPEPALPHGFSDLGVVVELMRYAFPGNLAGLPAISFPVGYDAGGLPIGMQAMARGWREDLLFRVARAAEQRLERRRPATFYSLLG